MSDIKDWSNTAASNNSAAPDGFPEGMNPSDVNNAAREVMAAVRRQHEDSAWIDLGDSPTQTSTTQFTISGDVTTAYAVGRRIRCTDTSTLYGEITASSYSNPNTTVTVSLDSGSLSVSLSAVALSVITSEANGGTTSGDMTVTGDLTATGTILPTGDTSSGDAAAVGYTAAEGLILTGQGAPNDITIKNDADADVLYVPTGSQSIVVDGTITSGSAATTGNATLLVGSTNLTTGGAVIEVGSSRSGSGAAWVDLHADGAVYTDYGLRMIRNSGANGTGQILHRGTGSFSVITDEAASIVFQTNSTTAGTFDTSQNLDVVGDVTAATVNADGDTSAGDNAAMGYTATEGVILTGQGSVSDITLKNDAGADVLTVPTGTRNVTLGNNLTVAGGVTITGGQVAFPATQNASANANTLDDYEEGTWTPKIWDNSFSDAEGQTYTLQEGSYTKIGRMVYIHFRVTLSSLGTLTTSETVTLAGLPFQPSEIASLWVSYADNLSISAGQSLGGYTSTVATVATITLWDATSGASGLLLSELSANGSFFGGGVYHV